MTGSETTTLEAGLLELVHTPLAALPDDLRRVNDTIEQGITSLCNDYDPIPPHLVEVAIAATVGMGRTELRHDLEKAVTFATGRSKNGVAIFDYKSGGLQSVGITSESPIKTYYDAYTISNMGDPWLRPPNPLVYTRLLRCFVDYDWVVKSVNDYVSPPVSLAIRADSEGRFRLNPEPRLEIIKNRLEPVDVDAGSSLYDMLDKKDGRGKMIADLFMEKLALYNDPKRKLVGSVFSPPPVMDADTTAKHFSDGYGEPFEVFWPIPGDND